MYMYMKFLLAGFFYLAQHKSYLHHTLANDGMT